MPQDVDFFFDFISPYTYLADTQLPALQKRTGARIRFRPMHLLKLMKMVGNVPTTILCANKMKYASQDLGRWVSRYGVPFQMNPHLFGGDQSLSLRGALVAQKQGADAESAYNRAIYRAFWADAVDTNDRGRLEACIDAAGLDGKHILEAADQGEYDDLLTKNTQLAAERGVFGSPTFLVGEEMFFGNDRLEFLEQRVRG
jgi:2-hydroxychromene-2-carboxylate isomerase